MYISPNQKAVNELLRISSDADTDLDKAKESLVDKVAQLKSKFSLDLQNFKTSIWYRQKRANTVLQTFSDQDISDFREALEKADVTLTEAIEHELPEETIAGLEFEKIGIDLNADGEISFDRLFAGDFGGVRPTGGLNSRCHNVYVSAARQSTSTLIWKHIEKEVAEYADGIGMTQFVTSKRQFKQICSLYAVKYAMARILFGHAGRTIDFVVKRPADIKDR